MPCYRANTGGLGRLYRFFAKKKQLELFNTHFVVRTLKLAFMPNFSQIGKVTWPRFFLKFESYRLLLFINCSVGAVISLCIGQFLFLGKNNIFWLSGGPYDKRAKNNFPLNRHFLKLRFPSKNVPLTSCWTNLTERKHTTRLHSFTFVTEHFLAGTDSAERLVLKWLNIVSAKVVVVLLHLVGSVGPILL